MNVNRNTLYVCIELSKKAINQFSEIKSTIPTTKIKKKTVETKTSNRSWKQRKKRNRLLENNYWVNIYLNNE